MFYRTGYCRKRDTTILKFIKLCDTVYTEQVLVKILLDERNYTSCSSLYFALLQTTF